MTQHEKVRQSILEALSQAKYNLPDGKRRSAVYAKLEEALLWLESDDILKAID